MPKDRWTRFRVSPIGTTLRPADSEWYITPEMVAPIAPNTQNARGHQPVQTLTPFPFANCYHWIDNYISVRVKVRPEHFDHEHAVQITTREHIALIRIFADDYGTMADAWEKGHEEASRVKAAEGSGPDSDPRLEVEAPYSESVYSTALPSSSQSSPSSPSSSSATKIDPIFLTDIFGLIPDPKAGLIPLVDLWFELEEHLSEDTIPNPVGLFEEERTIQSCAYPVARK